MEHEVGQRVGQRMRALRKAAGLTQAQLAERVQPALEPETVGRMERGERTPPLDRLAAIAEALGTDLDGFLAGMLPPGVEPPGTAELRAVLQLLDGRHPDVVEGVLAVVQAHLAAIDRAVAGR